MEPTVIQKAKQFVPFIVGDVQLLDTMNFLGGATSLDSSLKIMKHQKLKVSLSMKGLTVHER